MRSTRTDEPQQWKNTSSFSLCVLDFTEWPLQRWNLVLRKKIRYILIFRVQWRTSLGSEGGAWGRGVGYSDQPITNFIMTSLTTFKFLFIGLVLSSKYCLFITQVFFFISQVTSDIMHDVLVMVYDQLFDWLVCFSSTTYCWSINSCYHGGLQIKLQGWGFWLDPLPPTGRGKIEPELQGLESDHIQLLVSRGSRNKTPEVGVGPDPAPPM